MGNLSIKADILAGTDIEQAIREAISLAENLGTTIEISFNGCFLCLHAGDNLERKVEEYHQWLSEGGAYGHKPGVIYP